MLHDTIMKGRKPTFLFLLEFVSFPPVCLPFCSHKAKLSLPNVCGVFSTPRIFHDANWGPTIQPSSEFIFWERAPGHHFRWPPVLHCRSKVPITPSMGLNHLFWQVTGFREALTFTSLLKATIKRHRWTARWIHTQGRVGVSAPWHWVHPPPGTWMCPEPGSSLDITLCSFCGTFLCRHNQFVYYDASKFVTRSQTGEWDHHHLELMWKRKLCSPTK